MALETNEDYVDCGMVVIIFINEATESEMVNYWFVGEIEIEPDVGYYDAGISKRVTAMEHENSKDGV